MRNKLHTFKSFINESKHDSLIDFKIPNWALSPLINGDESGLTDEDQNKLRKFINDTTAEYGNANFMLADDSELDLGFCHNNDIDNLGSECSLLYIKPSKSNESNNNEHDIKVILDNYLEAALFTDEEQMIESYNNDNPNDKLEDGHFTIYDFTDDAKQKSINDIKKFLETVGSAADGIDDEMLGHDFWLTRNHHGADFLDREYPENIKNILYKAAQSFKEVNVFIDGDKKLIIE